VANQKTIEPIEVNLYCGANPKLEKFFNQFTLIVDWFRLAAEKLTLKHHIDHHTDLVKFLLSEERKQWHNPQTILNEIGITKGMIIADLGSGPGFFTMPMAEMIGENGLLYAVDSSKTMLKDLKENIAKSEVNPNIIKIVNSDVCHTGIPKESVDLVFFANFLHEVEDKKAFFQEVRRISKPTAYVVDVDWKKVQTEYGPPFKLRLSEDEAKRVLAENGFFAIKQIDKGPYHYELICKPTANC
jgi:ubiquinone/menaquinone biosynthesis C-methylase UbiE